MLVGSASAQFANSHDSSNTAVINGERIQLKRCSGSPRTMAFPRSPHCLPHQEHAAPAEASTITALPAAAYTAAWLLKWVADSILRRLTPLTSRGAATSLLGAGYRFNRLAQHAHRVSVHQQQAAGHVDCSSRCNGRQRAHLVVHRGPVVDLTPKRSFDVLCDWRRRLLSQSHELHRSAAVHLLQLLLLRNVHPERGCGTLLEQPGRVEYWHGDSHTEPTSGVKIFAEARYLDVLTPAVTTEPNGLGTTTVEEGTRLLPVTIGVRL